MQTTQQLYEVFKKKISNQEKADRLNISLSEYDDLKTIIYEVLDEHQDTIDNLFIEKLHERLYGPTTVDETSYMEYNEDLEKGTMRITTLSSDEPRSPEDIIKLLKIDESKWKLSQYWNKQKGSKWEISALVNKIKDVDILQALEELKLPAYHKINRVPKTSKTPACAVISLQDLHFGKSDDLEIAEEMDNCLHNLISKACSNNELEKIIVVFGGDILNMDTFNDTTTSGTILKSSTTAVQAYLNAFNSVCRAVAFLSQFCDDLHVVYIPGNHDRLSSFHLLHAVSQAFINNEKVLFDVEYSERKVVLYGDNMFCFEHGDVSKKNTVLTYATEFPLQWGTSRFRRLYTGHYHIKKTTEVISENEISGFTSKVIPSLCSTDYWHYHNKFTGSKRAAVLEVNDKTKGMVAEYIYTIQ